MNPFNKTTRSKIAACEALGLSYWADHPLSGRVWAVDSAQQAHVVRVYQTKGTAALQEWVPGRKATRYNRDGSYTFLDDWDNSRSYDVGERVEFQAA